jgi:hypothetical protein
MEDVMNWKPLTMKRVLGSVVICALAAIGCLSSPLSASALTVETHWTYTEEAQAKITGFRILNKDHVTVVDNIAATARTITFDVDATSGEPMGWYLVAFVKYAEGDEDVSWPSNMIVYCPAREVPPAPTGVGMTPQEGSAGATTFHGTFK